MKKHILAAIIFFQFTLDFDASAASWDPRSWAQYCSQFLQSALAFTSKESSDARMRKSHNRMALRAGRANYVSDKINYIKEVEGQRIEWINVTYRKAAETVLDESLPKWREDGDWHFQTARDIYLYTPTSELPVLFRAKTYILMNGRLPVGTITPGLNGSVELFETATPEPPEAN